MKNEAEFQTLFGKWIEKRKNVAHEAKFERTKRFNLKQWVAKEPQQARSLAEVKHKGFYYKIPDVGNSIKPFDCFTIFGDAYLVIAFSLEKKFVMVDIDLAISLYKKQISVSFPELQNLGADVYSFGVL